MTLVVHVLAYRDHLQGGGYQRKDNIKCVNCQQAKTIYNYNSFL
jgi:hypothetical protein